MTTTYFAYGSNLNMHNWHRWCRHNGVQPDLLQPIGRARLPDFRLAFSHRPATRGEGVLNVIPSIGHVVEGSLFEVDDAEGWSALNHKVGAPDLYHAETATVFDSTGQQRLATTYMLAEDQARHYAKPTDDYVSIVGEGLTDLGLPMNFLLAAAEDKPMPFFTNQFFVYGTLMRGESRFRYLPTFGIEKLLMATAVGRMLDLRQYPGLVYSGDDRRVVHGELVQLRDFQPAMQRLDQVEDFRGFGDVESLYSRSLIQVDTGDGKREWAWIYMYQRDIDARSNLTAIESGCWRSHRGRKSQLIEKIVDSHCDSSSVDRVISRLRAIIGENDTISDLPKTVHCLVSALVNQTLSEQRLSQASGNKAAIW